MKSVAIISDNTLDLAALAEIYTTQGRVDMPSKKRLVVEGAWGWFAMNLGEPPLEDFDESELAQVKTKIARPCFAQLEYSTGPAADAAITLLPSNGFTLIDNDHGLIAPLEEIRRRISEGSAWQTASA